jgi:hypothetical protein
MCAPYVTRIGIVAVTMSATRRKQNEFVVV